MKTSLLELSTSTSPRRFPWSTAQPASAAWPPPWTSPPSVPVSWQAVFLAPMTTTRSAPWSQPLTIPLRTMTLKIVEPNDTMLAQSWEPIFASFVYVHHSTIPDHLELPSITKRGGVVLRRDNRESSSHLADLFTSGVKAAGGNVVFVGVATTPQLHVAVRMWNAEVNVDLQRYTAELTCSIQTIHPHGASDHSLTDSLVIDCAIGIGSKAILPQVCALGNPTVLNTLGEGPFNFGCGADFVHKNRCLRKVQSGTNVSGSLLVSLDGDGERLIMYRLDRGG